MLFDAYVMIDWSACSRPARGADSIWACCARWFEGQLLVGPPINPATRFDAIEELCAFLRGVLANGRSVLVGFDFPFGYPSGFARRLALGGAPWSATWQDLARGIADLPNNRNNRFEVAARLNARVSADRCAGPFWGVPRTQESRALRSTREGLDYGVLGLAERRITEQRASSAQPVWKLFGNGSVGSQALLGIARLHQLMKEPGVGPFVHVWPFQGLELRDRPAGGRGRVVLAEIYPSLVRVDALPGGPPRDAVQVTTLAKLFADHDRRGTLADLLEAPGRLADEEREKVLAEEGWILGLAA